MRSSSLDLEIEAALVIRSESPQVVAGQIAGLTSVGNYRLVPQDSEMIHDFYLDTPGRALQAQKLALRIREIGGMRWITLKGGSQPSAFGGVERLEIEARWSKEALTRAIKELVDRGIKVPQPRQRFGDAPPLDVVAGLGLQVIQERSNHRKVRDVVLMGQESGLVLAQLVVDCVVYHFGAREIRHHEVEIEAKVRDGSPALKDVIESLVATYGPALQRWDHGKLVTGKAIEALLSEGALEGLLEPSGNLKPVAYDKIGSYLKRGRSGEQLKAAS
jgi:hypothetical protein